jgi:HK97 gp10 family phage protein
MANLYITGNYAQVQAALATIPLRVDAADEVVEEAGAHIVAALAARLAPRLTGHLKASVDEQGGQVVADTPYAGYQEYGTRHHAAQPFMRPAKESSEIPVRQAAERIYTVATR